MGNESHISFNRAILDDKFTDMLTTIIHDNYDKWYEVEVFLNPDEPDGPCWKVCLRDGILDIEKGGWSSMEHARNYYSLYIWRGTDYRKLPVDGVYSKNKGKFSHGHMRCGTWGYWFMYQLHAHFCVKYGARTSDDGDGISTKYDPTKYPTFEKYVAGVYPNSLTNPKAYSWLLSEVPEGLKTLRY